MPLDGLGLRPCLAITAVMAVIFENPFFVFSFSSRQIMSSAPVPDADDSFDRQRVGTDPLPVEGSASTDAELSQYERERNERIAANRQLLVDLGLASAISDLAPLSQTRMTGGSAASKKRKPTQLPDQLRRSRRGTEPDTSGQDLEEAGVKEEGHAKQEQGPPARSRAVGGRSMEERMKDLAMGSLVDLTSTAAVWIVLGSTRKPYKVSIGDLDAKGSAKCCSSGVRSKCQCRDFRVRRCERDCKHITLLKTSLCLRPDASGWYAAASRHA